MYNRVLTAAEISKLYNEGQGKQNISSNNAISNGLLAYWTFDGKDTLSNVKDVSGNGTTAYFTSTAATSSRNVKGVIGQATAYTGIDGTGTIITPTISAGTTFTYAGWIYIPSGTVNSFANLMTNGNATGLWVNNDKIDFDNGGAHLSNTAISRDTWHHIAVVDNATAVTFYLDGNPDGTATVAGASFFNGMGCDQGTGAECFRGYHDDVRLYSRALSAQEIKNLYGMGQGKQNVSPANSLTSGLASWWTFDGKDTATGVARDASGNGNHGNLTNIASSTFYAMGKIGQGFLFDGTDDRIATLSDTIGTGNVTVMAWIKPRGWGGSSIGGIVTNGSFYFEITSGNGGSIEAQNQNNTVSVGDTGAVALNKWTHVAITRSGTTMNFYVNGVANGTANQTNDAPAAGSTNVQIGGRTDNTRNFDGIIDDVRIYNRILTATEINQIYNLGR